MEKTEFKLPWACSDEIIHLLAKEIMQAANGDIWVKTEYQLPKTGQDGQSQASSNRDIEFLPKPNAPFLSRVHCQIKSKGLSSKTLVGMPDEVNSSKLNPLMHNLMLNGIAGCLGGSICASTEGKRSVETGMIISPSQIPLAFYRLFGEGMHPNPYEAPLLSKKRTLWGLSPDQIELIHNKNNDILFQPSEEMITKNITSLMFTGINVNLGVTETELEKVKSEAWTWSKHLNWEQSVRNYFKGREEDLKSHANEILLPFAALHQNLPSDFVSLADTKGLEQALCLAIVWLNASGSHALSKAVSSLWSSPLKKKKGQERIAQWVNAWWSEREEVIETPHLPKSVLLEQKAASLALLEAITLSQSLDSKVDAIDKTLIKKKRVNL